MQFEINLLFHVYALVGPELASGLCTRILISAPGIDLEVTMRLSTWRVLEQEIHIIVQRLKSHLCFQRSLCSLFAAS